MEKDDTTTEVEILNITERGCIFQLRGRKRYLSFENSLDQQFDIPKSLRRGADQMETLIINIKHNQTLTDEDRLKGLKNICIGWVEHADANRIVMKTGRLFDGDDSLMFVDDGNKLFLKLQHYQKEQHNACLGGLSEISAVTSGIALDAFKLGINNFEAVKQKVDANAVLQCSRQTFDQEIVNPSLVLPSLSCPANAAAINNVVWNSPEARQILHFIREQTRQNQKSSQGPHDFLN